MPFVENQGAKLYWDEQGSGEPVLLIMGLSYPSYMWHRSRPVLANRYRTIAFDNRGVGQSDVPPGAYSIPLMASDAAAVLDAAGVESAHVLGFSMGGMIAQEFALQYPSRVRSLILGCTADWRSQRRAGRASSITNTHAPRPVTGRSQGSHHPIYLRWWHASGAHRRRHGNSNEVVSHPAGLYEPASGNFWVGGVRPPSRN